LKLGDNNTKYFHTVATKRNKSNHIQGIEVANTIITEPKEITLAFSSYYKDILGKKEKAQSIPPYMDMPLQIDELPQLISNFTNTEIEKVVSSLAKGKACGPDGFPSEFFQTYWDIVGPTICRVVKVFQINELDLWRLNHASITIIPKKEMRSNSRISGRLV
jgi:hypothetical protein